MPSPSIKPSVNIAIVWGTNTNLANFGANTLGSSGTAVESFTITPKNSDPIDIEDGDGFAAVQVGCKDGWNGKATCLYDSNKSIPAEGANITVIVPNQGGTGTVAANATFWSWGFTRSRKKEAMVELNFSYRPGINT